MPTSPTTYRLISPTSTALRPAWPAFSDLHTNAACQRAPTESLVVHLAEHGVTQDEFEEVPNAFRRQQQAAEVEVSRAAELLKAERQEQGLSLADIHAA